HHSEDTMIDITTESTLSLTQAVRLLPPGRRGRPVTLSCLLRWVLEGVRAPDGRLVRLEALRLGGRWVTTRQAIQRFAESLTPHNPESPPPALRTPRQRRRAADQAEKQLETLGI